jgi:hypothetical protein
MQEMFDIGALPLPDDLYYSVYVSNHIGTVTLTVLKPRKWLWDKYVFSMKDYPIHVNGVKESVTDVIKRLSKEHAQVIAHKQERLDWYENAKKYEGEHK